MANRRKHPDLTLHVTRQNVKDGIANDQKNCTFGQCELSRSLGMDFYVDVDPTDPRIWAEWIDDKDERWHRADVSPAMPAITVVAATDIAKRALLKKFPRGGMDFVLTNHVSRDVYSRGSTSGKPQPGETEEDAAARREASRARKDELKRLRAAGLAEPPQRRRHPVRARFGGKEPAA